MASPWPIWEIWAIRCRRSSWPPLVDAALVPVGGVYTLDAAGAKSVCDALKPRCVLPMHYRHAPYGLAEVGGVEPFLALWPQAEVHRLSGPAIELTKAVSGVLVPQF